MSNLPKNCKLVCKNPLGTGCLVKGRVYTFDGGETHFHQDFVYLKEFPIDKLTHCHQIFSIGRFRLGNNRKRPEIKETVVSNGRLLTDNLGRVVE